MKVITPRPMKVIAAYPCLGKTTIYQANKDRCFDLEFNESRATRYMYGNLEKKMYFDAAAEMTMIIWNYGEYDCLFITEDERLIKRLNDGEPHEDLILVYPNAFDEKIMEEYKERVINRSGIEWWNRVLAEDVKYLPKRILTYQDKGYDVRLTDLENRYIGDVVEFPNWISISGLH